MMPAMLLAAALAALAQPSAAADEVCYERAIVGRIRHADHFVGLDHFLQGEPGDIALGGRWDLDIGVDRVLAGASAPKAFRARAVLTEMFMPRARLLILLKQGPIESNRDNTVREWNGRFIPRASAAIPWRVVTVESWRRGLDLGDPGLPPPCP